MYFQLKGIHYKRVAEWTCGVSDCEAEYPLDTEITSQQLGEPCYHTSIKQTS